LRVENGKLEEIEKMLRIEIEDLSIEFTDIAEKFTSVKFRNVL